MLPTATILQGDALTKLRALPDESVHCCVTSPPYWGLRDYGTASWEGGDTECDHVERYPSRGKSTLTSAGIGQTDNGSAYQAQRKQFDNTCGKCGSKRIDSQLGLEKTPEEYVAKMVEVFREVRRVLRKDGTLWLNLGDSYGHGTSADRQQSTNPGVGANSPEAQNSVGRNGLKAKDLCGIPWRVAFALQADGWWLRSDIIWHKPNPMPESITDRPTKSHEYLFLLTKRASYFYDAEAIKEAQSDSSGGFQSRAKRGINSHGNGQETAISQAPVGTYNGNRNKRTVWTVATAPYPEAHFATYPPDLIKPCIMAEPSAKGCCSKCGSPWERVVEKLDQPNPERSSNQPGYLRPKDGDILSNRGWNGRPGRDIAGTKTVAWQPTCECYVYHGMVPCTVLDPFAGSGTTGEVALEFGRKAILIELNPKYVELINHRCCVTPGLALN